MGEAAVLAGRHAEQPANAIKRVVYTAVFGGYDLAPAPRLSKRLGIDAICFTDAPETIPRGWQVVEVPQEDATPALANRRYKILAHRFLPDHSISMYVDARVGVRADPWTMFEPYLDNADVVIPRHRVRNCVYTEAVTCVESGKADASEVRPLLARFQREGFPKQYGLPENGVIVRRHHASGVVRLMEAWWHEVRSGIVRDQLYLPYVAWRTNTQLAIMSETLEDLTPFFRLFPHKPALRGLRGLVHTLLAKSFVSPMGLALDTAMDLRKRVSRTGKA